MNIIQEHLFKDYCLDPDDFHPSKVQTIDTLVAALKKQSQGQTVFGTGENAKDYKYYGEGFESWFATAAKLRGDDPRIDLIGYRPSGKDEFGLDGYAGCHIEPTVRGRAGVQIKNPYNPDHVLDRFNTGNLGTPLEAAAIWQLDRVVFVTTGDGVNRKILETWNQNRHLVRVINRSDLENMFNHRLAVWETWHQSLLTAQVSV
jgi:hypothetical protein